MLPRAEIVKVLKEKLNEQEHVVFAYLFGSSLDLERFRDVDVGVFLARERYTPESTIDLELSSRLQKVLACPVDVIIMNRAPDHLIHQISKGELLLDRDVDLRVDFITSSWKRYFDLQPKRREYLKERVVVQ
jgi:predicted nucleotidyltransferase